MLSRPCADALRGSEDDVHAFNNRIRGHYYPQTRLYPPMTSSVGIVGIPYKGRYRTRILRTAPYSSRFDYRLTCKVNYTSAP